MSPDEKVLSFRPSALRGFFAKPTSRKVAAIVGGATLVIGIGMGASSANGSAKAEIDSLKSQLSTVEDQNTHLSAKVDELTKSNEKLEKTNKSLETSSSTKTATITSLSKDLQAAKADLEITTQRIEELEAATQRPAPIAAPMAPKSVYYKNCTEARNAGVTPIYQGQPGYATHLDRDRDGIACE
ncbi:MAG: excalibur calcium-binding domain-containing protein [Cryobacterium sp.]|nr:excalibur calcium-binding domain-containing protein [Cryobacterium sp.]